VDVKKRLYFYFLEADKHKKKIINAKKILFKHYPISVEKFEKFNEQERDKLDVLVFRFSKLQDLIGEKIFRYYYEFTLRDSNISFVKILTDLERDGILEVEKWRELRDIRNNIAHEYPYDEENLVKNINRVLEKVDYLFEILEKIKKEMQ